MTSLQVPMLPSRWFTVVGSPDCSREMQQQQEEEEGEGERASVGEKVSRGRRLPTTRRSGGSTATRSTPSSS